MVQENGKTTKGTPKNILCCEILCSLINVVNGMLYTYIPLWFYYQDTKDD